VHPEVVAAYQEGKLAALLDRAPVKALQRACAGLPSQEAASLALLAARSARRGKQ
jgi:hypothetical protein